MSMALPSKRPKAWWDFESPITPRPSNAYEQAALYENNLLRDDEREMCERMWEFFILHNR
jgi:hypothetical protein